MVRRAFSNCTAGLDQVEEKFYKAAFIKHLAKVVLYLLHCVGCSSMNLWIDFDSLSILCEMNFDALPSERCNMLTADGISSFLERRGRLDCKEEVEFSPGIRFLLCSCRVKMNIIFLQPKNINCPK